MARVIEWERTCSERNMLPDVQDGLRFAIDVDHSELDSDTLAHRAVLKLSARGVAIAPLAIAGAALEVLQEARRDAWLESIIKGLTKN